MKHRITIEIEAISEKDAAKLGQALVTIKNSLSDKDLLDLAKILTEKPGIIKTAKKFLG